MQKKRWSEMSPRGRLAVSGLIAVSLILVGAAQRDLQRRPQDQIRGAKPVWRVACLNALGAVNYFLWGRKGTSPD